jgi:type IV secretory pathway component VirB8
MNWQNPAEPTELAETAGSWLLTSEPWQNLRIRKVQQKIRCIALHCLLFLIFSFAFFIKIYGTFMLFLFSCGIDQTSHFGPDSG